MATLTLVPPREAIGDWDIAVIPNNLNSYNFMKEAGGMWWCPASIIKLYHRLNHEGRPR